MGLSNPHALAAVEGLLAAPWGSAGEGAAPKRCEVWCLRPRKFFLLPHQVLTVCVCQRALCTKPKAKQNEAKGKKGQTTQKPPFRVLLLLTLGDPFSPGNGRSGHTDRKGLF